MCALEEAIEPHAVPRGSDWLAAGMSVPEIPDEYPELTHDDILACLAWAAAREQNAVWVPGAA